MDCEHVFFRKRRLNAAFIFFASFIISLLVSSTVIFFSFEREQANLRRLAELYGHNFSQKISLFFQTLAQNLGSINTLLVLQKGGTENFEYVARQIYETNSDIININLAKNGIVTNVFPKESNRSALGHDLIHAEDRKQEAVLARLSGKTTITGPFELIQGGVGLAFRQPIFLPPASDSQEKIFWGFAIITYRFPEVLRKNTEFNILSAAGFSWALWRRDPSSGRRTVLLSSGTPLDEDLQRSAISLQNATWYLDVSPVHGWINKKKLFLYISIALSICVLFPAVVTQFAVLINKNYEISIKAKTDCLTGLYNKNSFWDILEPAVERHLNAQFVHGERRLFLCIFDLNNFKQINDTYGHITGDKVLVEFARRLSRELTPVDFASRFGGDEFVAVFYCAPCPEDRLPEKFAHMKHRLEGRYRIDGEELDISVSFGVISPRSDMLREKKEHLSLGEFFLEKVDRAMYSEKNTFHRTEGIYKFSNAQEMWG